MSDELERLLKEQDEVISAITERAEKAEKELEETSQQLEKALNGENLLARQVFDLKGERDELAARVQLLEEEHEANTVTLYDGRRYVSESHAQLSERLVAWEAVEAARGNDENR